MTFAWTLKESLMTERGFKDNGKQGEATVITQKDFTFMEGEIHPSVQGQYKDHKV